MYQSTGDVDYAEHKRGCDKMLNQEEIMMVIQLLSDRSTIYLDEIQEELYNLTGTCVHYLLYNVVSWFQ